MVDIFSIFPHVGVKTFDHTLEHQKTTIKLLSRRRSLDLLQTGLSQGWPFVREIVHSHFFHDRFINFAKLKILPNFWLIEGDDEGLVEIVLYLGFVSV